MLPFSVRASGPAFISEVAWAGSSASLADEWLELCGPAGTDLSGWSVEGASAEPLAFPDGSAIPASGAFLIANYARDDARSTLDAAPDLVTTAVSLSNSALAVVLRDAAGNAVDSAGDGSAPAAGTSGAAKSSMERADVAALGAELAGDQTAHEARGANHQVHELPLAGRGAGWLSAV